MNSAVVAPAAAFAGGAGIGGQRIAAAHNLDFVAGDFGFAQAVVDVGHEFGRVAMLVAEQARGGVGHGERLAGIADVLLMGEACGESGAAQAEGGGDE